VKFAYADPPYLGLAEKLYGHLHPQAADYDRVETHKALVDRLVAEFPDGIFCGGRKRPEERGTVRDYCAVGVSLRMGFVGAKPEAFCHWIFEVLGADNDDELCDVFPGSGAVGRAWDSWRTLCHVWGRKPAEQASVLPFEGETEATA
jgi:hypothetical protein